MQHLAGKTRLEAEGDNLSYVYFHDDFPYSKINNFWEDTSPVQGKTYVVQTTELALQRCILMTTNPGILFSTLPAEAGPPPLLRSNGAAGGSRATRPASLSRSQSSAS